MAKATGQPVQKNSTYTITIQSLGHSGEGVGRYKDFTVFVPYALPGETVEVYIEEVKKNYAKGRLVTITTPSPARTEPACPIYLQCGGCQLQHMDYPQQLKAKRQTVVDAVQRIGKLEKVEIHATLGAETPWYYRNKMQFPVGMEKQQVVMGCYAQGTHRIVDTDTCLIQHDSNNQIVNKLRYIVSELGIAPYDEEKGTGVLRHVLGRVGTATGQVMVVLVTTTQTLPQKEILVSRLQEEMPNLVSIIQNINPKKTNVILGNKTVTLWGQDTISDKLGSFAFHISARSFFQVNTKQAEVLYNKALEYASLTGKETVIDAYCGTGTITLFLAQKAKKVYGIEIIEPAIENARRNAQENQVANVEFAVGDAVDWMPHMYKKGLRPEVIVVDPPKSRL